MNRSTMSLYFALLVGQLECERMIGLGPTEMMVSGAGGR